MEGTVGSYSMPVTVAARVTGTVPVGFRWGKYPNGDVRLQGCYVWNQGIEHGYIWKDIETVFVDKDGQAIY